MTGRAVTGLAGTGSARPAAVLLDVNETLTDLSAMGPRFTDVGLDPAQVPTWFAQTLRDGFALGIAGRQAPFAEVAGVALTALLAAARPAAAGPGPGDRAVGHVLGGFSALPLHPDVAPGLRALADAGVRVAALTNGSASVNRAALDEAGVGDLVDPVLSVADAGVWKPGAAAYRYGLDALGLPPSAVLMVAVHPWDLDGAARCGLATALIARTPVRVPPYFAAPTLTASGLDDLARRLLTLSR